jgi:Transposase zinc-binding domain
MRGWLRDNLATLLAEASELGRGLPRYVERDFARYLECGVLAHGFARVRCESCKDELLVAFSCKGRGVCPSCNAKRAHVTAAHLVERVLPHVPYRQWTLSFPHRGDSTQRGALHSGAPGTAHAACEAGPGARGHPKARGAEPKQGLLLPAPAQSSSGAAPRQGRWPGPGRRVSAGEESVLRRPGVRFMGSPSAALSSRSAPALYPQQGPLSSYTSSASPAESARAAAAISESMPTGYLRATDSCRAPDHCATD